MLEQLVFETLAEDACRRKPGVTDGLYHFSDVQFNREWDYSLPTFVHEITYSKVRTERATLDSFRQAFFHDFPELQRISLDHVLLAGGCIGHYMTNTRSYRGDVDMFIYGLEREEADARVCALVKNLIAARKAIRAETNAKKKAEGKTIWYSDHDIHVRIIRNSSGLSVFIGQQLYQIIFRLYTSKSEILHGFDIGSSAVGFDGRNVYFTALSRFSYEFMCNIVDTTRRSTTYERRLQKYWDRRFDLILPDFDMSRVRTDYLPYSCSEMVIMPHLTVSYREVSGNQIVVERFYRSHDQPQTDYALDDISEYNVLYINMTHLLSAPEKLYHYHQFVVTVRDDTADKPEEKGEDSDNDRKSLAVWDEDDGSSNDEEEKEEEDNESNEEQHEKKTGAKQETDDAKIDAFFQQPPFISVKSVKYFYRTLRKKVYKHKRLLVGQLERYVTVEPVSSIVKRIFIDGEDANAVLDDVTDRQLTHVLHVLQQEATVHREIPWITENPGTQLTSSINPIIEEPEKWYGAYYLRRSTPAGITV